MSSRGRKQDRFKKSSGKPHRKNRPKRSGRFGELPPVATLQVLSIDEDGEILLAPTNWDEAEAPPPVYLKPVEGTQANPREGQRLLARLTRTEDGAYEATLMRLFEEEVTKLIGVFHQRRASNMSEGGRVTLADRKARGEIAVAADHTLEATDGDLVEVQLLPAPRLGLKRGRILKILGRSDEAGAISLIVIAAKDMPTAFSPDAIREADAATVPDLGSRTDLRDLPLITIDGEDARDFDDAVFAEPDISEDNPGGWHIVVAIADVSHYVQPESALDREAYRRGNSVYFPDRVVPMLPEALSNGLCSLKPHEPRACLAFELWVDAQGRLLRHQLARGLMRSAARLTYNQVQAAHNGAPDEVTGPLAETVIAPLYGAYASLSKARAARGTLELDLPERKVVMGADGKVAAIAERERLDSHRLIEEFMILANVAAAQTLGKVRQPALYRVHDRPDAEKLDSLREFIRDLGFSLPKGQVIKPAQLTQLLLQARNTAHAPLINELVLRSQAQALYSPDNIGHFGLALRDYAHFTSPIRRYADLIVHRALIRLARLGPDGISEGEMTRLEEIGQHISQTERRAAEAEREAVARYTAAFMASHIGSIFEGRISGVSRFGLFVRLNGSGGEGLIPISSLPGDFYVHDEKAHRLTGRRTHATFALADPVTIKLREADGITGSTLFSLVSEPRTGDNPGREKGRKRR